MKGAFIHERSMKAPFIASGAGQAVKRPVSMAAASSTLER
ncbi:hypothetical protein C8D88_106184 [Lentzea atacamensis]|uniref:Uncharacterized protein n=1 Tax=Lentzea atacamensis TaxID=531938 RepID=A0A316HXW5_9PSEU|nr:hypothetical protein C8D88_106184 [Lentzea atacamensis]RAS66957.1 hypothetical protein C8D87_103296 [Lentzea atacamensis]